MIPYGFQKGVREIFERIVTLFYPYYQPTILREAMSLGSQIPLSQRCHDNLFFKRTVISFFLRPDGAVKSRHVSSDGTNIFRGTLFRVHFTLTAENL